jgi:hypothetical protein
MEQEFALYFFSVESGSLLARDHGRERLFMFWAGEGNPPLKLGDQVEGWPAPIQPEWLA